MVSQGRFPRGQTLKRVLNTGRGVARHVSSGGPWQGVGTRYRLSLLPLLLLFCSLYLLFSPNPRPGFSPAFSPTFPLFFRVVFFPAYFRPGGGPRDIASLTPLLAPQ